MRCVLKEYAPVHGKIWKHVTDSGSNMVCAFRNAFDDDLSEEEAEAEQAEEDDAGMFDRCLSESSTYFIIDSSNFLVWSCSSDMQ